MLSKLSVKQMNLPESEKCDWKSCNITWTTANSKYDKTTHNPLAGVWIIYLTVSTSINSRMNEKTHRIWLVATRVSNALWIAEKYKKNINVIGVLWASKTTFPLVQTEETFHKLKWSCDVSCTQHWPSSRSNLQTSSGMRSGTLCRAQRGKFRLLFWSLMWVPHHKYTFLGAFTISFIYATSPGSCNADTLFLIRIIFLFFS